MNNSSETNPNGSYLGNYTSRFASRLLKSSEIEDEEIKLITKLGSGTFGTVWKGECFGSTVAIKVPIPEKASALTREEIEYLRNEINIMTTNLHPNLILCLGACTEPSKFKIVLELMDGDLERLLIKSAVGKKMTVWQRMSLAKDAARGMLWLHSMNPAIIHRDLKLENLMYKKIDKSYHVKISDFGLSILKPQRISRLRGERVGTLTTMAPEILKGSNYNEKADVYSFSMLLWQIFTCERLYADLDDLSNEALETGICKNEIRPKVPSDCLPSLKKLMEDCWHDNPEKRPDFEAINASLDAILVELAIKDPHGRSFWSEHFLKEHLVPWDEFSKRFYEYLGTSLPEKSRRRYSEIFARTNYLCLKTILTNAGEDEDACVHIEKFGELLNLFGPLNKRRASSLRTSILDNIRKVVSEKWFHGTVERAEAHRRLEGRDAGTFLVRVTPKEHEAFVLTILKKKGGTPHNLAIHKKEDGRFIVGHDESKTYLSLNAVMREIEKLSELQLIPCPGWPFSSCFDDDERCEEDSNAELSSTYSRVADLMSSMRMDTRDRDRDREDEAATSSSAATAAGATTISAPRAAEAKGTREPRGNRISLLSDDDLLATAGATSSAATATKASPLAKAVRERDDHHQSPQTPLQPQLATDTLVTPRRQRLAVEREEDERRARAERERERERDREEERDLDERLEVLRAKLREREKEREDTNLATDNGRSKEAAASLLSGVDEVVRSPRLRTRDRAREREQRERERERERERDDDRESKKTEDERERERERDRDRGFIGVGPMRLTRRATDDPSVATAAAAARSPLLTSNLARERERERERDEQRLQRERDDRAKARERERERAKTAAASDDYVTPAVTTISGGSGDAQLSARPAPRDEERDRELRALDEKIEQLRAKIREREREREREMEDGPRQQQQQQQLAQQHDAANLVSVSPVPASPISTVIANNKAKEDDGDVVSLATGSSSSSSGSGSGLMSSISSGGSGGAEDVGASPDLQDRRKQREEERRKQREKWQKEEEERKRRREQIKRQLSERPGRE